MNLIKEDYTTNTDKFIFSIFCMMAFTSFLVVFKICGALKFSWLIVFIPIVIPAAIITVFCFAFIFFALFLIPLSIIGRLL